jgi:hypothetical protein
VNDEEKQSLDLKSIRRVRSTSPVSLQEMKGSPKEVAAVLPDKTSFLKKEEAIPDKIEIAINTKRKPRKQREKLPLPKYLIPAILGVMLLTVGLVFYIFFGNRPFYQASWKANLTDVEKAKGIKELGYELTPGVLVEHLSSEVEGLSVTADLTSKMQVTRVDSNSVSYRRVGRTIEKIQVNVPSILCQKSGTSCEQVTTNFENTFKEEILKQDETAKNIIFTITKLSSDQIKMESDLEGVRVLQKN